MTTRRWTLALLLLFLIGLVGWIYWAIRKIERETGQKRVKIIGMTAYALPADRDRCIDAGMDDYLAKPFRPEDLRKKLDT